MERGARDEGDIRSEKIASIQSSSIESETQLNQEVWMGNEASNQF